MKCEICELENAAPFTLPPKEYQLCGWCLNRVREFINTNINHSCVNIAWGCGKVGWHDWFALRDMLRTYNIREVLEIGSGLSSELMVNEGIKLVSFDFLQNHSNLLKNLSSLKNSATFHWYDGSINLYDTYYKLYPDRKWDFVFVDSPHERSTEVRLAMEISSRFIFLHDPNLGEQGFFPNEHWVSVNNSRLYEKQQ